MAWAEVKSALNATLGNKDFLPLDEMVYGYDPTTLPNASPTENPSHKTNISMSPDDNVIVAGGSNAPTLTFYKFSNEKYGAYTMNANFPYTSITATGYSGDGKFFAVGSNSPRLSISAVNGDNYNVLTLPTQPPTSPYKLSLNHDGSLLLLSGSSNNSVYLYKRQPNDEYTQIALPAVFAHSKGGKTSVSMTKSGTYMAVVAGGSTPVTADRVNIYKMNPAGDGVTFVTALMIANADSISFTGGGEYLAVGRTSTSNSIYIYSRSGDVFTQTVAPVEFATGKTCYYIAFSANGKVLAASATTSPPNAYVWNFTGSSFSLLTMQDVGTSSAEALDLSSSGTAFCMVGGGNTMGYRSVKKTAIQLLGEIKALLEGMQ